MKDFSDEVSLVTLTKKQDDLMQWKTTAFLREVWCDLSSVTAQEATAGGQSGFKERARVTVHTDDYRGEALVYIPESIYWLPAGYYDIYRKWVDPETIDLYIERKEGVTYATEG